MQNTLRQRRRVLSIPILWIMGNYGKKHNIWYNFKGLHIFSSGLHFLTGGCIFFKGWLHNLTIGFIFSSYYGSSETISISCYFVAGVIIALWCFLKTYRSYSPLFSCFTIEFGKRKEGFIKTGSLSTLCTTFCRAIWRCFCRSWKCSKISQKCSKQKA